MTLASDVLPPSKITEGISRFAFTISIGMAVGPFVGIQVQNYLSSKASFLTVFAITVVALICVLCCKIKYPKVERKKFALKDTIYKPAFPFMFNMMFLMIPYGAVIAYSSILAGEKNLTGFLPYFYIFLVVGMLLPKLSTQKMIDAGKHKVLVYISLVILILTMVSYKFLNTGIHLLLAGFFFGLGYGILQPLFQSFVTGTTLAPKRGVANATYLLSYDIGIGIGSLLMGFMQESIGLSNGFALTVVAYIVGFIVYMLYVDKYYEKLKNKEGSKKEHKGFLSEYMEHEIYTINENKTVRDAITFFTEKNISGAPIISETGKPVGYITDGDIMRYMKVDEHHPTAIDSSVMFMDYFWNTDNEFEEKLNSIMDLNVLEIGTNKSITIDINASMEEALKLLSETGIKKIPVIKNNKIVGIISRSVMTQFLVKRYLVKQYLKNKKKEEIV